MLQRLAKSIGRCQRTHIIVSSYLWRVNVTQLLPDTNYNIAIFPIANDGRIGPHWTAEVRTKPAKPRNSNKGIDEPMIS